MVYKKYNLTLNRTKRKRRNNIAQSALCPSPFKAPFEKRLKVSSPSPRLPAPRSYRTPRKIFSSPLKSPYNSIFLNSATKHRSLCKTQKTNGTQVKSPKSRVQLFFAEGVEQSDYSVDIIKPTHVALNVTPKHRLLSPLSNKTPRTIVCAPVVESARTSGAQVKSSKSRVQLFDTESVNNSDNDADIDEMLKLAPNVISELKKRKIENVFLDFFRTVAEGKFPFDNIAFLLWIEVVRWYRLDSTSGMRYMEETKKFWKLGWRLFGGKFVRFMTGFKNVSQVTFGDAQRGLCKPEESEVNFIVPDVSILRTFSPYGTDTGQTRLPGIYTDVIKDTAKALSCVSSCLSFDGKKLKQGLTANGGDIDLLGFEDRPSLQEKQAKVRHEIKMVSDVITQVSSEHEYTDVTELSEENKRKVHSTLHGSLVSLGHYAQTCRKLKDKKEYAKQKFIERSGSDWRHGQFVYVISAINAFLYDIDCFLRMYETTIDTIAQSMANLCAPESAYVHGQTVQLECRSNYQSLEEHAGADTNETRKIKQRSPAWHAKRNDAKVTGSTIYSACGLDTLKKQQTHFDRVICGIPEKDPTPEVQGFMQYGTENEINATSTLVAKILPALYPELVYYEEGCISLDYLGKSFMVVSPDGSLRGINEKGETEDVMGVEFKCPVGKIHDELPQRYVLQCLSEMEALRVEKLLYVCWRPDLTSVFELTHNTDLFQNAMKEVIKMCGEDSPRRPSRLPENINTLRAAIKAECTKAKFLGEFRSTKNTPVAAMSQYSTTITDLRKLVDDVSTLIKDGYELQRQKATEAMVFLVCDLNRNWSKDPMRWAPVCWSPKGYSLTGETFLKMVEEVRNQCFKEGMHIPCSSFDGQWHNLAVRDIQGRPLTILQLQKEVWNEMKKIQKSSIVKIFSNLNKTRKWWKSIANVLIASNGDERLPKLSNRGWDHGAGKKDVSDTDEESTSRAVALSEVIPEEVIDASVTADSTSMLNHHTLQYITSDESVTEELLTCNPSVNTWSNHVAAALQEDELPDASVQQPLINLEQDMDTTEPIDETTMLRNTSLQVGQAYQISPEDAEMILKSLKADRQVNAKRIWNERDPQYILTKLQSVEGLISLRDADLRIIAKYFKHRNLTDVKGNVPKWDKICAISKVLGIGIQVNHSTQRSKKRYEVKKLAESALKVLSGRKVPKLVLNIAYAEFVWPDALKTWKQKAPLSDEIKVEGLLEYPGYWFYIPEYSSKREQLEISCIDSSHLLTRTRRKICKGGIEGLSNKAWIRVAKSKKTFLTPIMVEDIVDPMSVPMAQTHFSSDVEHTMRMHGDIQAANLCHDVRSWWRSEDEAGISALDRIRMRIDLRRRLLGYVDFTQFPPPSMYVGGWPIQLWEALVSNIDAKSILYSLTKSGSYNVRAFSSMMGETFFSEVANQDKRGGQGTLTTDEFAFFMGTSIEQMHMRLDKKRSFVYRTSRSTVYNLVDKSDGQFDKDDEESRMLENQIGSQLLHVKPRDHFFDTDERNRNPRKQRMGTVSVERNAIQKGTLGVRWEKARVNESKMLPTRKMGIEDN